jgi:hypothetical protein
MEQFERHCRKVLKPVLEGKFGSKIVSIEHGDFGDLIKYQNKTTGITIHNEPRDGIFVSLSRLVNGKIPDYPLQIEADTSLNTYSLEDIISFNTSRKSIGWRIKNFFRKLKFPVKFDTKKALKRFATELDGYAADILKGNFEIFPELEKIVKKRARVI